jgi:hypothetical protein
MGGVPVSNHVFIEVDAPKIAKHVHVKKNPDRTAQLFVDGTEFPYAVSADSGIDTSTSADGITTVTLTIFADQVTIDG